MDEQRGKRNVRKRWKFIEKVWRIQNLRMKGNLEKKKWSPVKERESDRIVVQNEKKRQIG